MQITVEYAAQVKRAAGLGQEVVDLPAGSDLQAVIRHVAQTHGETLADLLLTDGELHPSILLFVNDQQVHWHDNPSLTDGQTLAVLSPISGG